MSRVCALWRKVPDDLEARVRKAAAEGARACPLPEAAVFFRADDVALPSAGFARLAEAFVRHRTPLALAVVPAWLTPRRRDGLLDILGPNRGLFCLHQHGRRHTNHQASGRKMEFGPDRTAGAKRRDLALGRGRLEALLGRDFFPAFTPPWNRCDAETLAGLADLGFACVSRSRSAQPPCPDGLPDLFVNCDLHTRKEPDPESAWAALLGEVCAGLAEGRLGIMLHHPRMNAAAFRFLDLLLPALASTPRVRAAGLPELIPPRAGFFPLPLE